MKVYVVNDEELVSLETVGHGEWDGTTHVVTYADHVAALAEAEHEWACGKSRSVQDCGCRLAGYAEARAKWADIGRDAGYDEGYADALGKAREAVEEHRVPWPTATGDLVNEGIDLAVAAIDALGVSDG